MSTILLVILILILLGVIALIDRYDPAFRADSDHPTSPDVIG